MRTRRLVIAALLAFVICVMASACFANERETVLDRKVHIEDKILDVPKLPPLCEEIKGLQREKIDIGNGKLYCEQEGTGVPLVVVSGGPGSTHHTFHSYFSRAAAFARVIYYDQRGVGQSDYDKTGKMYTLEQAVEDLDNLRKALKIEKWVVLGHSYGGFLAQCYALEHPDRLLGLVLVCSAPGNGDRQSDYMSEAELQQIDSLDGNITLTDDQCRFNRELNGDWKRQSFYKPSIEEMARTALYEWKPAPGFQSRICSETRLMELMASLNSKFDRFPVPTLVMESKRDLTWAGDKPVKFHRNHPGSQLVMFEKSAHSPFADEPDKFFKALLSFTENVRDGSKTANVRSENRVRWQVPAVCYKIEQMPFTGAADEALQLLPEAEEAKLENSTMWFTLGYHLCSGFYYDKALIAFQQSAESRSASRGDRGLALAYQGLLLDLLNHRAEAVAAYREALRGIGQAHSDSDVFGGITIDRQWVKERIKTPFVQPPEVYYE
ncbi:MAG: alpha/beta fold hydrolase, partial [Armatimonadetes bacterium]|nr:alpha/beta fold hydrolase [Armatimonadota bacterium]